MDTEHYRDDLGAAVLRIERLEHELALYRADPAHERVAIAEEKLARALERRQRAQKLLPRALIGSFAAMGAFALTDPTLPPALRLAGYGVSALGAVATLVTMTSLLALSAQGARPAKLQGLERELRLAKGDVGVQAATSRVGADRAIPEAIPDAIPDARAAER